MDSRGRHAKCHGCLSDVDQLALWRGRWSFEIGNIPAAAQTADKIGGETMTIGGSALLAIENARNDRVGVMVCETTYQRDRVLVGAYWRRAAGWQVDIDFAESAAAPTQGEMGATTLLVDGDDNLFKDRSKQFLLVSRQGRWCLPDFEEIGAEREQTAALVGAERPGPQCFAVRKLSLGLVELAETILPFRFETAGDEPVVGIKCGAPHMMPEICMSGSMSGERKRSDAAWPKQPRLSSTLPEMAQRSDRGALPK